MTATNHVITGVVVTSIATMPAIGLPLAFLSHFALDALPHYDTPSGAHLGKGFLYMLAVDSAMAASILLSLALLQPDSWRILIAGGILAASPDLMWLPRWINELRGKANKPLGIIAKFHSDIQRTAKSSNWPYEVVWFGLMLVALGLATR